jgi:hypothetical protein
MTEEEWLASKRPHALLSSNHCDDARKTRLFACGCARRVLHFLTNNRFAVALRASEEVADGTIGGWERLSKLRGAAAQSQADLLRLGNGFEREQHAAAAVYRACEQQRREYVQAAEQAQRAVGIDAGKAEHFAVAVEEICQAAIVRDLFGNPFRPVAFAPEWRTDTAIALARTMYESREFSAMPILADALQDAGCDNPDILNHCRDINQLHVRGCWVVDLVLNKS